MTDVVSAHKRSEMMAGIRGKNTRPEIRVRQALFSMGYRFRLHRKDLPGKPDIVLPGRKIVIFVHGCFWHGHSGCHLAKLPSTRPDFWRQKFESNRVRDNAAIRDLLSSGWRVLVVWECFTRAIKDQKSLSSMLAHWIESDDQFSELTDSEHKSSVTKS